jgi:hypothetical protein
LLPENELPIGDFLSHKEKKLAVGFLLRLTHLNLTSPKLFRGLNPNYSEFVAVAQVVDQ